MEKSEFRLSPRALAKVLMHGTSYKNALDIIASRVMNIAAHVDRMEIELAHDQANTNVETTPAVDEATPDEGMPSTTDGSSSDFYTEITVSSGEASDDDTWRCEFSESDDTPSMTEECSYNSDNDSYITGSSREQVTMTLSPYQIWQKNWQS